MNINKLTNANCQARFVIVIFTNKYTLVFGHHLNQLTKLHHSFIELFIVQSPKDRQDLHLRYLQTNQCYC